MQEIITADLGVLRPQSSLLEAAEKILICGTGALPVCDGGRLVGIVTTRDLTVRAFAYGHDPRRMRVKAIMTRDVIPCFADDTNEELVRKMRHYQVRGWPIVNHEQRLVGMVTSAD